MEHLTSHSPYYVKDPKKWILYVSRTSARRLVVFVHGFGGKATSTWDDFGLSGRVNSWWKDSDMLFIGYDSWKDGITGTANLIREKLPEFYPTPFREAMLSSEVPPRDDTESKYDEMLVLGHSLGGLIVRRVVADSVALWIQQGRPLEQPPIANAKLRLFSPAIFGFRPTGFLGLMLETSIGSALSMRLRMSSSFQDLQPDSVILAETRRRTEEFALQSMGMDGLYPDILWAHPDKVVITERYATDRVDDSTRSTHTSVCKPNSKYMVPWQFAQTGEKNG